jgi:hypothetical protein
MYLFSSSYWVEKAEAASELERQIVHGLFFGAWLWRSYHSKNCASSVRW